MFKKTILTFFLVLIQTVVFGATNIFTGANGGNWSVATNWSTGAVPMSTDDVVIPSGKTVILGTNVLANSISISGTLSISFKADITINTQLIVVTSPNGHIDFDHSTIRLPSNVSLYLQNGSNSLNGSCNNNDEIFVGAVQYAVCTGGGALYLFQEIENAGGINVVTAGVIGASQAICSGATPATLTSTTAGTGSGTITYEWQTNALGSYVTISGATSATYSPPALTSITSYQRRTKSVSGIYTFYSAYTTPVTITVDSANTWTGTTNTSWFTATNWSCGSVPTAASDVTIPNFTRKPIIDDSSKIALANTLTVESGSSLSVNSGNTLKVTHKVTNNGGTITFEDSASLVQTNNVTNSGNITYKRYANIRNTDYTYWSSPVAGYTLGGVSQNKTLSDKYYSYNSTVDNWQQESAATIMTAGIGYIVRGPEPITTPPLPPPPGLYQASFVGVPNNGNISVSGNIANRSYLLGNPYPSAISADKFLVANAGVLNGTLYFWTHRTPIGVGVSNPGTGTFAYSGDDYAVYNATGGVGAAPPDINPVTGVPYPGASPSGSEKPNGYISVGQGFFASTQVAPSSSSIVFDNSMREVGGTILPDGTKINQQFFKTKNLNTKTIEKNRVWLNLSNTQGAFKQTLIGYLTDATNEFDSRFDGESFDGHEYVDFYSINQDKNLTIQGRALPFDENDEVQLGYRTTINGEFTINIDQVDGSLTNQAVFLEDKLTSKTVNLKEGNYTFNTAAGTFNDRFVLRYTNKTLGKEEVELNDGIIALYSNNYKTLIIRNNVNDATVNAVELFNLLGQNITNWEVDDSEQINIQIPIKNTNSGIYIVKIKTTQGEFSKKIIIK